MKYGQRNHIDPLQIDYDYQFVSGGDVSLEKLFEFKTQVMNLDRASYVTGLSKNELKKIGLNGTMLVPHASQTRIKKDYFIKRIQ